jgi:FAD/FMN-containing dehydrogenase
VLSAQSGAIWADIQSFLHPRFAVKSMQSTDLFTIGGSMSVNAHGMDQQAGSVGRTVRSFRFMFTDGHIETISREGSPRLFNLIIGGYGMFGVILDVKLDVVDNVVYKSDRKIITYTDFPEVFKTEIEANKDIGLFYGHLSTARSSLLKDMILYTYTEVKDADPESVPVLTDYSMTSLRRFLVNFSKMGRWPMEIKWFGERYIEPRIETCDVHTRNKALGDGERCLVSRNEPMHDSVSYLRNSLKNDTDILQEYYIPRDNFVAFIDDLREIVLRDDANLLNASVRVIHKEDNYLTYASGERFAVVLYLNQKTNDAANKKMEKLTKDIIDVALKNKGTFFLPYQLYYTPEQLKAAYPMIKSFFDAKKVYDPEGLLQSTFYEKYHLKV